MPFSITFAELFDVVIMTFALGFIFKDAFLPRTANYDPLEYYKKRRFGLAGMKLAMAVTAPAIILHELGHKLVAVMFGLQATFNAAYTWLGIGVVLKLLGFPFVFFVPAYVAIIGRTTPLQDAFISLAGPGVNFILWLVAWQMLKRKNVQKNKELLPWLVFSKKINMFLFIFNMIPLPFFDGYHFFQGIITAIIQAF
jgi:Zn-dependent protease